MPCQGIPEPCYSGTVYCLAFTGKLKAPVIAQFLLFILPVDLETAQFILKAVFVANTENTCAGPFLPPSSQLLKTCLTHVIPFHVLTMTRFISSASQLPALLFLTGHSQPASTRAIAAALLQASHSASAKRPRMCWGAPNSGSSYCQCAKFWLA